MNDAIVQEMARKGWQAGNTEVAFQACDDSLASTGEWDENLCRSNADAYAGDPDVIGVIGTYNSGCAQVDDPDPEQGARRRRADGLARQHPRLPDRSRARRSASRTSRTSTTRRARRNYVRVVPNDAVQGAGLASFANEQGIRRPFVLVRRR